MGNSTLRYFKNLALIIVLGMSGFQTKASGWVPGKGHGFLKLGQSFIYADRFFSPEGRTSSITTSGYFTSNIYGEYGLTDKVVVGTYVPFLFRSYINGTRFTSGRTAIETSEATNFGDVDIFLKYGLVQGKPLVLSVSLLAGIPTGKSSGLLTSGDGEWNQMVALHAGYSHSKAPVFAAVTIGFNNRTSSFSDEFRFNFEAGYTFKSKATVILKSLNTRSLKNGNAAAAEGGIFSNDVSYSVLGPEVLIEDLAAGIGLTGNYFFTLSGRNTVANDQFGVGLFYKF